jgi:nucleoside-triphosphatase THEP1
MKMIMSQTTKWKIANDLDVKEVGKVEVIEHDVQNLVEDIFQKDQKIIKLPKKSSKWRVHGNWWSRSMFTPQLT